MMGNVASLTDPDGNMTQWTYDGLNQPAQKTGPLGPQPARPIARPIWLTTNGNRVATFPLLLK